jgi:hypothetical protein
MTGGGDLRLLSGVRAIALVSVVPLCIVDFGATDQFGGVATLRRHNEEARIVRQTCDKAVVHEPAERDPPPLFRPRNAGIRERVVGHTDFEASIALATLDDATRRCGGSDKES